MLSITQLEYIVAVHRTGNFGKAAAECDVSQPTLSAQVAKAEETLGVVIFDRRSRPVQPTEPGKRLVSLAVDVLTAHKRLLTEADETERLCGKFTLGIIPTLAPYVLPWFLGPFAEKHPRIELTVLERPTLTIVEEIKALRMDAGLLATPLEEPSFETRVLFYDPFYVYAHANSPLLLEDEVAAANLEHEPLWLLEDSHCFRNQVVHLCGLHNHRVMGNVRFDASSFETLRALIDHSGGCTLVPETFARMLPSQVRTARIRPFCEPVPTREVSLIAPRTHWKTDILDALTLALRGMAPRSLPRTLHRAEVVPIQLR
jgi:LysR family hydrogen peroxide-inducible transcriptional activator